jgi:hypothetical protein
MGGVIELSKDVNSGRLWAGWAFRQILEDTLAEHPEDLEMAIEFEQAQAIGGLLIYDFPEPLRERVIRAIRSAVEGILNGTIRSKLDEKPYNDPLSRKQYREVLESLQGQFSTACE